METCKIVVGTNTPESIPIAYWEDMGAMLDEIKQFEGEVMYTNNPLIINGCKRLHRDKYRQFYIAWARVEPPRIIELDNRGDFIQPWPDYMFEIDFHCSFGN